MLTQVTDRRLIIALLAIGALLKSAWLGRNELSGDEPFTVFWATRPMAEFLEMLWTENNPPLYFLLIKAWIGCAPLEEAWLRVPSALFSILTVWPLFLLGRALGGRMMAVITCLLFMLSNHQYAYAHEVRAYSLLLLLTVLAMWLVVRGPSRSTRLSTMMLAAVFAAMAWTHFFAWLVIGLCCSCVLLLPGLREGRRRVLMASLIAAAAFLPYTFIFFQRAGESMAQGTWVRPHGLEEIWHMVRRWSNQPVVTLMLLVPLVAVVVREKSTSLVLRFPLIWWLLPLIGLWLVQPWVPAYVDRYLLFASPGFYLAVGYGLTHVFDVPRARVLAPALGVLAMLATFTPWKRNDQRPSLVAAQVKAWQSPSRAFPVLVRPFWYKTTLWAHMDRSRAVSPPWSQAWSERYNDATEAQGVEEASEMIVVYMAAPQEDTARPVFAGFRWVDERQADPLVRVARYMR